MYDTDICSPGADVGAFLGMIFGGIIFGGMGVLIGGIGGALLGLTIEHFFPGTEVSETTTQTKQKTDPGQ